MDSQNSPNQDPYNNWVQTRALFFAQPKKSHNFIPHFLITCLIISLFLPIAFLLTIDSKVKAAPPYTASDVIGQLDGKGNPRFTSNTLYNNGAIAPDSGVNLAQLDTPAGVAVDETNHLLFVGDEFQNRVLVYQLDNNNNLNGYTASYVLGQDDLNTYEVGSLVEQNRIDTPLALAYDSNREWLFVGDDSNCRVMVFDLSGGITNGMNATYVLGAPDFITSTCGTTQDELSGASGLSFDPVTENLFVGDYFNRRVIVYDTTAISNGMNASHVLGKSDFISSGVETTQNGTSSVSGVHYDPVTSYLFVADDQNNRTLVFDLSGGITDGMNASFVLGQPDFITSTPLITQDGSEGPIDMAYDSVRELLYIAEFDGSRTMVYDLSGGISNGMNATYVLGQPNFTAQDFTRDQNGQDSPMSVEYLPSSDTILIGDFRRLLEYDASTLATSMNAQALIGQNNGDKAEDYTTYFYDGYGWYGSAVAGSESTLLDPVDHRLFVADMENQRILVYNLDSNNEITSHHADYVIGRQKFTDMTLNATPSQSNLMWDFSDQPLAMSYDAANDRLFVTDPDFFRVMVFDLTGGVANGMNASFVLGQPDFISQTPANTQDGMGMPGGVVYDPTNDQLFVSDSSYNRVLVYDLSGGISNGMNASFVLGQPDFISGGGPAFSGSEPNKMSSPSGLAFDDANQRLFVSEYNHVKVFDLSGGITNDMNASSILGDTDFTYGGTFSLSYKKRFGGNTEGLWYDDSNNALFVADTSFHRVLTFNLTGGITNGQSAVDVIGQSNFNDNSSGLSQTKLNEPTGVYFDSANQRLYISDNDNNRVMLYDNMTVPPNPGAPYQADNVLGQVDGGGNALFNQGDAYNGDGFGNPNLEGFEYPQGTVIDKTNHRLFVSECGYGVKVFNLDANDELVDRIPDYILGQADFISGDTTTDQSTLTCSVGSSYDESNERLFVPDSNHNRVLVYDLSGGISNGMNASFVLGQPDFISNGSNLTQDGMGYSYGGSAYDPATEYFYVSDSENARILVYDLSGGITNGMNATYVIGQPDFISNGNNVTQDGLSFPNGMVLDTANDRLFIADWGAAGRVLVYDTNSLANGMNASFVLGEIDFVSSDSASDLGPTPDAKSFGPGGLAYDSVQQRLFIEDANSNRVMIFDVNSITNNEDAVGWIGQWSLLDDVYDCIPDQTLMCGPYGMSDYYDTENNTLYVSDNGHHRILIYRFADLEESLQTGTQGQAYSEGSGAYTQGTPTYSITAGSLPSGLNLNASTGVISGTPSASGNFNFTVGLSDDNGPLGTFTDSKAYVLGISAGSPDNTPPSVPTGLHSTGATTTTISLAWNASTDNVGVTGYNIYRGGVLAGTVAGTSFTDTGLSPGTVYSYTVSAFDAASNESAQSGAINASTTSGGGNPPPPPPSPPPPPPSPSPSPSPGPPPPPPSNDSESDQDETTTTPPQIDLDIQPGFTDGSGYVDNAVQGSSYVTTGSSGSQAQLTVTEVTNNQVTISIDGQDDFSVPLGGQTNQDLDTDNQDDINVAVTRIDGGKADIVFTQISPPTGGGPQELSDESPPPSGFNPFRFIFEGFDNLMKAIFGDLPPALIRAFPWLIFLLLAMTIARLLWQARNEKRTVKNINELIEKENQLAEAKRNFVTLASHYLRTPMATISAGLELVAMKASESESLKNKGKQLGSKINNLVESIEAQAQYIPSQMSSKQVRIWALPGFYVPVTLTILLVSFANYLYIHIMSYQTSSVTLLTQIVAGVLLSVLLFTALRRSNNIQSVRVKQEFLLSEKRSLDEERNKIILSGVGDLEPLVQSIKIELNGKIELDEKIMRPANNGAEQFLSTLDKFKILAALKTVGLASSKQMLNLNGVIDNLLGKYKNQVESKHIKVNKAVQAEQFKQDELMLNSVIESLISNSLKYSPEGGRVDISSHKLSGGNVEIVVHDNGPGIPAEKVSQLFEAFSRVEDASEDFNVEGAGLSLYMDKLIMNLIGGKIEIDQNNAPGTTVKLTLPA